MNVVVAALSAPAQLNGVSRHGINLVRSLLAVASVMRVHLLAGAWQKQMFLNALETTDSRLHVHWISLADANLSRLLWYRRELPHIAAQLDADVVHLTFPAPIAAGAFHCPCVLSLHDLYPFEIPENFGFMRGALARRTITQCVRRVDAIACVSASTRIGLAKQFPEEARKAVIIPNVVERRAQVSADPKFDQLKGRSFVLCVAQHRRNKNVPLAIRIFKRLLKKNILPETARLLVIGIPGPETKRIRQQIREVDLEGGVLLWSGLSESELQWCYENCSVLLAPSIVEGFGLPVAEGALAGCRVVCSDIPAFHEAGGPACRFVPWSAGVIRSYAEEIREVLVFPKPPVADLPQFSLKTVGRSNAALYQSLICSTRYEFDMLRQLDSATEAKDPMKLYLP